MLTLRLTQFTEAENKYRVEVALEGGGLPRQIATSRFDFKLTPQDHEDLRWYLEDYLQYPLDPAPKIAARIEQRISEVGVQLFKVVFQLDLLRPPTFKQLGHVLRQAKAEGMPYPIVHFDGHGTYEEVAPAGGLADLLKKINPLLLSRPRSGAYGYLLFENTNIKENVQLVDGPALGKLLVETNVPVLVLNACRSAHAEAPNSPLPLGEGSGVREEIRAFGSLAQEVMDTGLTGVVAMRYNVYVVTAAQFVADFYATLTQGHCLGEAVTLGRKQLHDSPLREIAYDPRPLQDWPEDWPVPVIYEAAPIPLFPKATTTAKLQILLKAGEATASRGNLDASLPPQPDAGFFGRDETLLALDRAFDTQAIVLLHAVAGSGKTTTAAEFARWYSLTGGVQGPVLFTSFEQYKPLPRVLDQISAVFGPALEQSGVHWLALSDAGRRSVALQVLKQIPVLWIWDNVEPVAGFPAGTTSAWNAAEQKELKDFQSACRDTKAKVLLTSRRDEQAWLGDLAVRIHVPPMPGLITDHPSLITATRAFVEAIGQLGNYYAEQYEYGNRDVISALTAEEANLLHARRLASLYEWWYSVISTMQGLRSLYSHTGRRAEWNRLVEEIVPDFVDPATDGPLSGQEEHWGLVTGYRVRLAEEARQWPKAGRLQRVRVEWNRERAAAALALPAATLDSNQRNAIRTLAASLHDLGQIQRELGQKECMTA